MTCCHIEEDCCHDVIGMLLVCGKYVVMMLMACCSMAGMLS